MCPIFYTNFNGDFTMKKLKTLPQQMTCRKNAAGIFYAYRGDEFNVPDKFYGKKQILISN